MADVLANIPWTRAGIAIGGLILVYAWLQTFQRKGRAMGTITQIVSRSGPDGDSTDVPLITFTVEKRRYSFVPSLALPGEARRKAIGRKVAVAYNPDDPEDAEVASLYRLYLPPVVVSILYGAFLYYVLF